jgi:hypothetical protein
MAKRKKPRGSSNAGRKRKTGDRHPGGKLVQFVAPNERVVEGRQHLIGALKVDLSVAEDAMALALAHGWIVEGQHRAGETYARAYRLCHPQRSQSGLGEGPEASERDMRTISQMGSVEIVAAFDRILASTPTPAASELRQVDARRRYNAMCNAMTTAEQGEVFLCFCLRSWPQWLNQRAHGKFDTTWERKRDLLVSGLNVLANHLQSSSKRGNHFRNETVG